MTEVDIKVGQTYSGKRWKSDRKVVRFERVKDLVVVHYIDLRTSRTGNAPLELFAASTDRHGLVANVYIRGKTMKVVAPENTPKALLHWIEAAHSDEVTVTLEPIARECQGETVLPGDWFVDFDGQLGVLWRQCGSKVLVTVTRNDGMPLELLLVD